MAESHYWASSKDMTLSDYTNVWLNKEWHNLPNDVREFISEQSERQQVNPRPRSMGTESFAVDRGCAPGTVR